MFFLFLKILTYLFIRILYPTHYKGKVNIPKGRAIFICNHKSNMDPLIVELVSWKEKHYLSKKELFKNKFMNWVLKRMRTVPIERGKTDITAIKACLKLLNKEKSLVIFPEGTRNISEKDLGEIKSGAAMFAIKAKAPIVPIWIKKKPRIFRFNTLRVGKPFTLEEFYDKKLDNETLEEAGSIIASKLLENKI